MDKEKSSAGIDVTPDFELLVLLVQYAKIGTAIRETDEPIELKQLTTKAGAVKTQITKLREKRNLIDIVG